MKFKVCTWAFVMFVILAIEQIALQVVLPSADMSAGLEQMNGQSMNDSGFTLRDAAKNSIGFTMCFLWTLCVFSGDILRAAYHVRRKVLPPLERGKKL